MSYWMHIAAKAELAEAADFYFAQASKRVADNFLAEFARAIQMLEENQQLGTLKKNGLRIYPLRRFPYSIVYRANEDGPRVYAVANQRRRPRYWNTRL